MMSKHLEIEVKLRIADVAALRRTLKKLRAKIGPRMMERNVLLDTPDGRLRKSDRLLRLRTYTFRRARFGRVTFKGKSLPAGKAAANYKVRREQEFTVGDIDAVAAVFRGLGFVEGFRYEKYRTEVHLPSAQGAHVYLDETPIGTYIEVEGSPVQIDRAARLLGFGPPDYLTDSYLHLYAEHCRLTGRKMGNFVFRAQKKA